VLAQKQSLGRFQTVIVQTLNEQKQMNNTELDKRLSTHEAVCSERWLEILSRVRRLEMILIGAFGSIIMILLTIIFKLQ
tara:strand:+ start:431 stop:667 length:237 start_codon:yes stop_codon:yes gene_type:complete